jgi:shikimate kinase
LLLCGVSGVGKSTMCQAVGAYFVERGARTAVVDTDWLGQYGPGPASRQERSTFYNALKCRNLAAVWETFREAADFVVVGAAGVVTRELRHQYVASLDGCSAVVAELTAPPELIAERLRHRQLVVSSHPETHNETHVPLDVTALAARADAMSAQRVADFTVRNDRATPEVASELVARAGWGAHLP